MPETADLVLHGPRGDLPLKLHAAARSLLTTTIEIGSDDEPNGLWPVRLFENSEYVYEVLDTNAATTIDVRPRVMFFPDPDQPNRGRLRTGSYVGALPIDVFLGGERYRTIVEVQSTKLDYTTEYRWMVRDIADCATGLVLERFAPTTQRLTVDWTREPRTAYERFLHLQALFADSVFEQSVLQVSTRPYIEWAERGQFASPHLPLRGGSRLARAIVRPGPRTAWPTGAVSTIPRMIHVETSEANVDNFPNRFVAHVLRDFQRLALTVRDTLMSAPDSEPAIRGKRETDQIIAHLERLLSAPLFRDIGEMGAFRADNQVILKRSGYRDVLAAYLKVAAGTSVAWTDPIMSGGQRDAAALYEYWAFLQLLEVVRSLTPDMEIGDLIQVTAEGLSLSLMRGRQQRFSGSLIHQGRQIQVDLYYNRTFSPTGVDWNDGSWSMTMRPDCSIRLKALTDGDGVPSVWLHFDAKYRLADYGLFKDVVGEDPIPGIPVRDDVLKMHVYLAAIRRTIGSYVLFPSKGSTSAPYKVYRELLPGVGAFPLLPTAEGPDTQALKTFLIQVLDHVASVATEERRHRYWEHRIFPQSGPLPHQMAQEPIHGLPPADTSVLVGFVRTPEQWAWIQRTQLYNMRSDPERNGSIDILSGESSARVAVLFGPTTILGVWHLSGEAHLYSASQLIALDYPNPRGQSYICVALGAEIHPDEPVLKHKDLRALAETDGKPFGTPIVRSWSELAK